jgi:hypothetical protein
MQQFEAILIRPEGTGTWTYLNVPFSVEEVFGTKAQVRVKGTVNGVSYRGSLMPHGEGRHYLVVNKAIRDEAQVTAGDDVQVTVELDTEAREVEVPEDFLAKLETDAEANQFFTQLAYSKKKEYVTWIESAKKPETRENRIVKSLERLREGKKLKS